MIDNIEKIYLQASVGCNTVFDGKRKLFKSISPIDNRCIGTFKEANAEDWEKVIETAIIAEAFWKKITAPKRGQIIRRLGELFRKNMSELAEVITLETGKPIVESFGEVQEIIDIIDFAVGLSRQIYGYTIASERSSHRMFEVYHPLGVVGVITAFNFPMSVWAWNAMIGAVCGDVIIWKPSSKTPLCAIKCQELINKIIEEYSLPDGVFSVILGQGELIGRLLASDERVSLVSFTGSSDVGKIVNENVAKRFGRTILELGGNNAVIVTPSARLDETIRSIVFGAVGTAGQRCTSIRRVIIHESIYDDVKNKLIRAYHNLKIGNPMNSNNNVGPLIDEKAVSNVLHALNSAIEEGAQLLYGGIKMENQNSQCYILPAIVEANNCMKIVQKETFGPVLYLMKYKGDIMEAIDIQNESSYGLASSIFTSDLFDAEHFYSDDGSDCGIANVNISTSGAEIGGAFGGEKATGGGREAGSDAWKNYMRRQTCTTNFSLQTEFAQGVIFDVK